MTRPKSPHQTPLLPVGLLSSLALAVAAILSIVTHSVEPLLDALFVLAHVWAAFTVFVTFLAVAALVFVLDDELAFWLWGPR